MKLKFIKNWKCPIQEGRVWAKGRVVEIGDEYAKEALKGGYAVRANRVEIHQDKEKKVLKSKITD